MKIHKYFLILFSAFLITFTGCETDEEFLNEEAKSFLTTENAYLNKAQFEMAIGTMHRTIQDFYNSGDGDGDIFPLGLGTDVCFLPRDDQQKYNDWSLINEFESYSSRWYSWQYGIIKVANTIIVGVEGEDVKWNSDAEKNAIAAEAKFFRAFAYRNLAHLFGGVPIVSEPVTEPKIDFVRDTRDAVWQFAKTDLEFASTHLPVSTNVPGRIVKAAADHLLAEINICLNDFDGAIAAATRVINGDYQLMKTRFGTRADETDRNVYWDLFRIGNQQYQEGNKEAIWVAQMEYDTPGGTVRYGRPLIERIMLPIWWGFKKAGYDGVAKDSTGRGVAFVRATNYTNYDIWQNSDGDIRNSEACIKRKFYFVNDAGAGADQGYVAGDLIPQSFFTTNEDTMTYIHANWWKFGTDKHLDGRPDNGYVRDFYVIRLPETYLLRAEAYLAKGDKGSAADDINAVRARSSATPVADGDVTLDYILDERTRELYGEEYRTLTLCRLGLLYDRTKTYGYAPARASVKSHNNLFPIPQSAIDRNTGAVLEQNPGY